MYYTSKKRRKKHEFVRQTANQQNKYNAKRANVDGFTFDSTKEAKRYLYLKDLQKQGLISGLQLQKKFTLIPSQRDECGHVIEREIAYYADFVYKNPVGTTIVEDVKGYRNSNAYALFVVKRKLMLYIHGIRITEI